MNWKQWAPLALVGGAAAMSAVMAKKLRLVVMDDSKALVENEIFKAKIYPSGFVEREDGPPVGVCSAITLEVENLTEDDIEIVWAKTYYTHNGHTEEGFIHGGGKALRTQLVLPRRTDVVFGGMKFKRELKPVAAIKEFEIPAISQLPLPSGNQIIAAPLTEGVHGVYLFIKAGEDEYKAHMEFELGKEEKKGFFSNLFSKE